jgi:hypothetical protein
MTTSTLLEDEPPRGISHDVCHPLHATAAGDTPRATRLRFSVLAL